MRLRILRVVYILYLTTMVAQPAMAELPVKLKDILTNKTTEWRPRGPQKTGIIFISTHCPCFRNAIEDIKKQVQTYGSEVSFVAITSEKDLKKHTKNFYRKINLQIPIMFDKDMKVAKHFQVTRIATALILDSQDNILYRGGVVEENGDELLGKAIKDILVSGQTKVPFEKGLGCAIAE